jgi:ketosteroid isomerase-like protein
MDARDNVEAFVNAINSGRAERIYPLMSRDHVFIDSLGARITGKEKMLAGWRAYFQLFPDYRIEVDGWFADGADVMLHGRAGGTLYRGARPVEGGRWQIPAAWRAVSDGKRVDLWQVYADNKPVYPLLGG